MTYGIITKWEEMDGYEYDEFGEHQKIKERTILTLYPDYHSASESFVQLADANDDVTKVKVIWEGHINKIKNVKQ